MRDDAAFVVDGEVVTQEAWEAALPLDIPPLPVPGSHALVRAEIATSLDDLVPVELTFIDQDGEEELRLWLSHRSSFPLTSDFIEGIHLGDRGEILGELDSIEVYGVYYQRYFFDGCGLGLGLLSRASGEAGADLDWLVLRALALRTATDICPTADGPRPAISRYYPGLFVLDRQRVSAARWLSEAPAGLLYPSSNEHDFRLSGAEVRFARPVADDTRVSVREVEMRWFGLGATRAGFVIVARDEIAQPLGTPVMLTSETVGGLEDREREERHGGSTPQVVALRALSFVACGWTYQIEVEAGDIQESELREVAVSILDACGATEAGVG